MLTGPKVADCIGSFRPDETCESAEAHADALSVSEAGLLSVFGSDPEGPLRRWMQRLAGLPPAAFILFTTLYAFIGKVVAGMLMHSLPGMLVFGKTPEPHRALDVGRMVAEDGLAVTLLAAIFLAPLIETVLGQWLPIRFARIFSRKPGVLLWSSTVFFALMHLHAGWTGIITGISVGVLLAFAYLHWERVSTKRAYWITTAIHALHNGLALVAAMLFKI